MPRAEVLDKGYIEVVEHWGSDEAIIESARQSTSGKFVSWEPYAKHPDGDFGLLVRCMKGGKSGNPHSSVFEMSGLTIDVYCPIVVIWQWVRHRTLSYNIFSGRYSVHKEEFYTPNLERIKFQDSSNKQASGVVPLDEDLKLLGWIRRCKELQEEIYHHYEKGIELGISKEVARINTPFSLYSKMRVSGNLWNWLRFLKLRLPSDSQYEIRQYAEKVGNELAEIFPRTMRVWCEQQNG